MKLIKLQDLSDNWSTTQVTIQHNPAGIIAFTIQAVSTPKSPADLENLSMTGKNDCIETIGTVREYAGVISWLAIPVPDGNTWLI
jgi:hypothetical protein